MIGVDGPSMLMKRSFPSGTRLDHPTPMDVS
jgi:hypothetical protein